jgi:hypothetical protein
MKRLILLIVPFVLAGCATSTVRTVDMSPPQQATELIAEEDLLDVGVAVFDPNVPEDYDEQVKKNIAPEVRRAESNYMAYHLKNLLQSTGQWGAVRVVPRATMAVDATVSGRILESDGEMLEVEVEVHDATGKRWFKKKYETLASKYAYDPSVPEGVDPFQHIYRRIADDMLAYRLELTEADIHRIRTVAEMRFAREFSPDAFGNHIEETKKGEVALKRLPADDDPNLSRVRKVREREYLFIDTLDEYFAEFHRSMYTPYQDYRRASFEEALAYKELRAQARGRTIAGIVAIASGIAAQTSDNGAVTTAGTVGIIGGAMLLKSGLAKKAEAEIHAEVLQELGVSAEAEITPHTLELENQTVNLSGTVDAQYDELKRILRTMYYRDLGIELPEGEVDEPTADIDTATGAASATADS